jgi:hypothetical protein
MQTILTSGSSSLRSVGSPAVRSSKLMSVGRKLHRRSAAKGTYAEQEDKQVSGGFEFVNVELGLHATCIGYRGLRWRSDLVYRK